MVVGSIKAQAEPKPSSEEMLKTIFAIHLFKAKINFIVGRYV